MTRALRVAVLVLLMALPAALVVIASGSGVGISPDSVAYASAARSFAESWGLTTYAGEPLTLFPPGLPILLGTLVRLGLDVSTAAVLLNACCAALLVLGTYALGRLTLRSESLGLAAAAIVAVSAATIRVHAMLWTEPLFSVLVLALLVVLVHAVRRTALPTSQVILAVALVWFAVSLRFAGLVLIPVLMAGTWLAVRHEGRGRAARLSLVAGVAAGIGPLLLMVRNAALGAGPLGERYPGTQTIQGAVESAIRQLGAYVVPPETSSLSAAIGALLLAVLGVGAWLSVARRMRPLIVVVVFIALYWLAIWWSQSTTRIDTATERLASPVFAPMAVLAVFGVVAVVTELSVEAGRFASTSESETIRRSGPAWASAALRAGAWLALAAVLALSLVHGIRFVREASAGLGYQADAARNSALALVIRDLPDVGGVGTNDPWHVYWVADREPAVSLPPLPSAWPVERIDADLARLTARVQDGSVSYIAIFDDAEGVLPLEQLAREGLLVEPMGSYADGRLFRVSLAS